MTDANVHTESWALVDLDAFPTGFFGLVVPGVDVLSGAYSVTYELCIAIVAYLQVSDNPSCSRIHVSLELDHLFRESLGQSVQRITRAMVAAV